MINDVEVSDNSILTQVSVDEIDEIIDDNPSLTDITSMAGFLFRKRSVANQS